MDDNNSPLALPVAPVWIIQTKRNFPLNYDDTDNITWSIPRALVPIIAGHLSFLDNPDIWTDAAAYNQARQAISLLTDRLMP